MVMLRLWDCDKVLAFPPLEQLPSLKYLYIAGLRGVERVGVEFYGVEPSFVSLKCIAFKGMSKWKEWLCLRGQGGEFPRLKELYIENCPMLMGNLPTHLPFLSRLEIESCEQLVAPLPRVPAIRYLTTRSVAFHSGRNYHHYCRHSQLQIPNLWSPYRSRECCKAT